jgi:hypothetical protein
MTRLRDWHGRQADRWPDREDHAECRDYLNDYLAALEADLARTSTNRRVG